MAAWWTPTRIAQLVACALFAGAGLVIVFLPIGTSVTQEGSPNGSVTTDVGSYTVADDIGWYATVALAVAPLLLSVVPMLLCGRWHKVSTIAAAVIAVLLTVLALLSLGIFWLPGTLALVTAAALLAAKPQ